MEIRVTRSLPQPSQLMPRVRDGSARRPLSSGSKADRADDTAGREETVDTVDTEGTVEERRGIG
jgi:hypothetical protein